MTGSEEEWPKRRRGEECGDDLESWIITARLVMGKESVWGGRLSTWAGAQTQVQTQVPAKVDGRQGSECYGVPILQGQRHVGPEALRALGKTSKKEKKEQGGDANQIL